MAQRPTDNFRASNARALTYGIECDLEHQASYLETLVEALRAASPDWDFRLRAGAELKDLHNFRDRVECLELPPAVAAPLLAYMGITRQLLEAILSTLPDDGQRPSGFTTGQSNDR